MRHDPFVANQVYRTVMKVMFGVWLFFYLNVSIRASQYRYYGLYLVFTAVADAKYIRITVSKLF